MLEFSTVSTPIAKKCHVCDLCGRQIRPKEKYERFAGKYDGEMFDIKHHLLCAEIIRRYCQEVGDNEYDNDSVHEWAEETVCGDCRHYDDEREDYTPCEYSMFSCQKVIERFSKKETANE